MLDLREKIVRAHGGRQRWSEVKSIMGCTSMGGLGFASHLQMNPLRDVDFQFQAELGRLVLMNFPRMGAVGVFTPDRVWIEDGAGGCVESRESGADLLRSQRQHLAWDSLDVLHYAGTMIWQSLQLPFALLDPAVKVEEQGAAEVSGERWQRLLLRYPKGMPSMAAEQVLYCDSTGLVRRLDYSVSSYNPWLKLAQCWQRHESFSGLVYATRRAVHPCIAAGQVWRLITLVWLELDDIVVSTNGRRY
jgi:hypothetical protein